VRLVGEPAALLVVNHKGSISHASASLGALLGYSSKALAKMQLEDIIPVPYAQLHKGWIKVGAAAGSLLRLPCWLPASSAQAGGCEQRLTLVRVILHQ
jgi:hypothetical protein